MSIYKTVEKVGFLYEKWVMNKKFKLHLFMLQSGNICIFDEKVG